MFLFQDLPLATLLGCHQFKPIMDKLFSESLKYRWLYPIGIAFEYNNKTHLTSKFSDAAKILGIPSEAAQSDPPPDSSLDDGNFLAQGHGGFRAHGDRDVL